MAQHRYIIIPSNGDGSGEDPVVLGDFDNFAKAEEYWHKFTGMKSRLDQANRTPDFLVVEADTGMVHRRMWVI